MATYRHWHMSFERSAHACAHEHARARTSTEQRRKSALCMQQIQHKEITAADLKNMEARKSLKPIMDSLRSTEGIPKEELQELYRAWYLRNVSGSAAGWCLGAVLCGCVGVFELPGGRF